MVIETKELGFVEIDDSEIIRFPHAIYGFHHALRFALLKKKKDDANPFMWLQCVDQKEPCFIVVDPHALFNDYCPELPPEEIETIELKNPEDLRLLLIATVHQSIRDMYVNLRCPIMINARKNIAMQVILENDKFPMKYKLFAEKEG